MDPEGYINLTFVYTVNKTKMVQWPKYRWTRALVWRDVTSYFHDLSFSDRSWTYFARLQKYQQLPRNLATQKFNTLLWNPELITGQSNFSPKDPLEEIDNAI